MFYMRTADKLQRTARWIENLPGGLKYLREVILEDKLGICAELERQMEELVGTYFCEWTEAINNPERRKQFTQFHNTSDALETIEPIVERGQQRPTYWASESATEDFRGTKWSSLTWQPMIQTSHFADADTSPTGISANVKRGDTQLAIFKIKGKYYATQQMCPHKRAFVLSDGLVGDDIATGKLWVSCPMHKRNYELGGEQAGKCSNDDTLNIATFPVEEREDDGWVYVKLPPVEELDGVLGTTRWMVKKEETTDPFEKLDRKMKGMRGRKVGYPGFASNGGMDGEMNGAPRPSQTVAVGGGNGEGGGGLDW